MDDLIERLADWAEELRATGGVAILDPDSSEELADLLLEACRALKARSTKEPG